MEEKNIRTLSERECLQAILEELRKLNAKISNPKVGKDKKKNKK